MTIDTNTIFLIGGNQPYATRVNTTFFLDIAAQKWTPGVNFIIILQAAFTHVDPERARKRQSSQHCHFALLGSVSVKVVRRTLMKSNPGVNFIIILQAAFVRVYPKSAKRY